MNCEHFEHSMFTDLYKKQVNCQNHYSTAVN
jgi:hypothetical protein